MQIFHYELSLEEGFTVLDKENREDRLIRGRRVSACSGWELFKGLKGQPIRCYKCGCKADRWIADKNKNDQNGYPVVNLYGVRPNKHLVLFTRDHIIPKSLGGTDDVENLRPACTVCNGKRGNKLNKADRAFRDANPHLICQARLADGLKNAKRAAKRHRNPDEKVKILSPFTELNDATITALVSK